MFTIFGYVALFVTLWYILGLIYPEIFGFFLPKKYRKWQSIAIIWVVLMCCLLPFAAEGEFKYVAVEKNEKQVKPDTIYKVDTITTYKTVYIEKK